jgi:protein-S-isoprenylcysteine O-methyltransferase Ste14
VLLVIGIVGIFQGFYGNLLWYKPILNDLMALLLVGGGLLIFVVGLASFKRWRWYSSEALIAMLLSVVLTIALIHATLAIPIEINRSLVGLHLGPILRPLGYASFAATVFLMLAGFLAKRGKLSILGSIALYLPIFTCLGYSMFYLFGVGVLGLLWFPLHDFCPQFLGLGHIVLLPDLLPHLLYNYLVSMSEPPHGWEVLLPFEIYTSLLYVIMTLGAAILLLGAMTWLYGKFKRFQIIDFGIYRYTRHPQYLGFLLWSYGLLLFKTFDSYYFGAPRPSLFWLILALTIIGVALHEENVMAKRHGEKYVRYRNDTPFILPLPKQISTLINAPVRALLKKDWPENRKEITYVIIVYGLALVLLSALVTSEEFRKVFPILRRIY